MSVLFGPRRRTLDITSYECPVLNTTCVIFKHYGDRDQWILYVDGVPIGEVKMLPQGQLWLSEWGNPSVLSGALAGG